MDEGRVAGAFAQGDDERDDVQAGQGFGQALIVAREPAAARQLRSTTQRLGNSTKPRLAWGSLTTAKTMP